MSASATQGGHNKARDELDHNVICTSFQTDNQTSTSIGKGWNSKPVTQYLLTFSNKEATICKIHSTGSTPSNYIHKCLLLTVNKFISFKSTAVYNTAFIFLFNVVNY